MSVEVERLRLAAAFSSYHNHTTPAVASHHTTPKPTLPSALGPASTEASVRPGGGARGRGSGPVGREGPGGGDSRPLLGGSSLSTAVSSAVENGRKTSARKSWSAPLQQQGGGGGGGGGRGGLELSRKSWTAGQPQVSADAGDAGGGWGVVDAESWGVVYPGDVTGDMPRAHVPTPFPQLVEVGGEEAERGEREEKAMGGRAGQKDSLSLSVFMQVRAQFVGRTFACNVGERGAARASTHKHTHTHTHACLSRLSLSLSYILLVYLSTGALLLSLALSLPPSPSLQ